MLSGNRSLTGTKRNSYVETALFQFKECSISEDIPKSRKTIQVLTRKKNTVLLDNFSVIFFRDNALRPQTRFQSGTCDLDHLGLMQLERVEDVQSK